MVCYIEIIYNSKTIVGGRQDKKLAIVNQNIIVAWRRAVKVEMVRSTFGIHSEGISNFSIELEKLRMAWATGWVVMAFTQM